MPDVSDSTRVAPKVIFIVAIVMALLHQDSWFWDNRALVLGFLPIGLFYHACFSVAAGVLWACTVKFAWPDKIEAWADEFDDAPQSTPTPASADSAGDGEGGAA